MIRVLEKVVWKDTTTLYVWKDVVRGNNEVNSFSSSGICGDLGVNLLVMHMNIYQIVVGHPFM